jgi:hypothetical protein
MMNWMKHAMAMTLVLLAGTLSSILGVGIGATLEEARAALDPLGAVAGRETRSGGQKLAWTLEGSEFSSVALKTDRRGRVVWITGFVREGRSLPFTELGDLQTAHRASASQAIWNVPGPRGGYRLVAKGSEGLARVVYLLELAGH